MENKNRAFYDIHMHAFNLSHVGFLTFINRFFINNSLTMSDLLRGNLIQIFLQVLTAGLPPFRKVKRGWLRLIILLVRAVIIVTAVGVAVWYWFCFFGEYRNTDFLGKSGFWNSLFFVLATVFGSLLTILLIIYMIIIIFLLIKSLQAKTKLSSKISKIVNVLSIFDNDMSRIFRYLELDYMSLNSKIKDFISGDPPKYPREFYNALYTLWKEEAEGSFEFNGTFFNKVILTPLMMDFQYKGFEKLPKNKVYYNLPPRKPIIDQARDLFYGIMDYRRGNKIALLEIYPFLGLNTDNYSLGTNCDLKEPIKIPNGLQGKVDFIRRTGTLVFIKLLNTNESALLRNCITNTDDRALMERKYSEFAAQAFDNQGYPETNTLPKMLYRYFGDYKCEEAKTKLSENFNRLFPIDQQGDEFSYKDIGCYFYAGIKVYPPLGFDPWPPISKKNRRFHKVNLLYQFCCDKRIPVTTHCMDSGFSIIDKDIELVNTSPFKWEEILKYYDSLKLNFAHFGREGKKNKKGWDKWIKKILEFINNKSYVYADFACIGICPKEYEVLESELIKNNSAKLGNRILFGTDFMVNLFNIRSYFDYLKYFLAPGVFTNFKKINFVSTNPDEFLFKS